MVITADFFTPVVDDAYDWGQLPKSVLSEVLRGGNDIAREALRFVAGGHSIDDPEPKYGMAVTGLVDPVIGEVVVRRDAAVEVR